MLMRDATFSTVNYDIGGVLLEKVAGIVLKHSNEMGS